MIPWEAIVDGSAAIAALCAVVLAGLAFKTYWDLRPAAQLERRQDEYFLRLSAEVILILEALLTFWSCISSRQPPDPYLYSIYRHTTAQLHKILNKSADHELTHEIVGNHDNRWERHLAFRSALLEQSQLDLGKNSQVLPAAHILQPAFSCHFLFGLLELAGICEDHKGNPLGGHLSERVAEARHKWAGLLVHCEEETGTLWKRSLQTRRASRWRTATARFRRYLGRMGTGGRSG